MDDLLSYGIKYETVDANGGTDDFHSNVYAVLAVVVAFAGIVWQVKRKR